MHQPVRILLIALSVALVAGSPGRGSAEDLQVGEPSVVTILGYTDHAMEPFVSRDGRYLLFNNLHQPPADTDIHYAERRDDVTWIYRGKVEGVNTPALEGCPTMDRAGTMYFVSPRSYPETLCTIYTGHFAEGVVTDVHLLESISRKTPGIVNFDVDVSADGKTLIIVDSRFEPGAGPRTAELVIAAWTDGRFERSHSSATMLARVNKQGALQYAPTISADLLTLFFTRADPASGQAAPQIYRARRSARDEPFSEPVHLAGLGEFVEGSAFSANEHLLYYHRKVADKHRIYVVQLP